MKSRTTALYSIILLIFSIQCFFMGMIVYEQAQELEAWIFVVLFALLIAASFQAYPKDYHIDFTKWWDCTFIYLGALGTYGLQVVGFDPVLSAAGMGLIGAIIPKFQKSNPLFQLLPAPIYCGAFIGMTNFTNDPIFILIAATFTCLLYFLSKPILVGIGGKLGTLAFIGVVLTYSVYFGLNFL
ncbi:hypothetical protein MM236_09910 [Belliella sp. DSM 107340]|uniref:Prepilin type IV endopeptidase peptidase domain-containing protein n=1 Tax=Belliella calami TaxID=2923436 RepID=A0ABS9UNU4_9BACT|nr:hypothetical protein [Belliella calami]MCH7398306.1 hypothetical protein [Belliella calami]